MTPLSCNSRTTPRARIEIPAPSVLASVLLTVGESPPADLPLGVLLLLVIVVVHAAAIDLIRCLIRDEELAELEAGVELQGRRPGQGRALIDVRVDPMGDLAARDQLTRLAVDVPVDADPGRDGDDHLSDPEVGRDRDRLAARPRQVPQV